MADAKDPPGFYSLANLPQRAPLSEAAFGSGWWELDRIFKFYHGQFVVVTGKPGHGKSTFVLNVLAKMAKEQGIKSFLYVPENEAQILNKLMRIYNDPEGFPLFAESECFVQSASPEAYNDDPVQNIWWVLDRARHAIEQHKIEVVYLDPWNEFEHVLRKGELLTDYIRECLRAIKQFSRCFDVSVVMVAHPTKAGANKEETISLADIEGSMSWYNKCDNGLIVEREPGKQTTKIISAKVREIGAGRIGQCYFNVDPETEIFTPVYGAVNEG